MPFDRIAASPAFAAVVYECAAFAGTLNIAAVNSGEMIITQKLVFCVTLLAPRI